MPYEICRKYCLLVRNYSYSDYSYLIRNVMNYITLHIAEDLSLTAIADYFHKNPSYLSGQFQPESRGESLRLYPKRKDADSDPVLQHHKHVCGGSRRKCRHP